MRMKRSQGVKHERRSTRHSIDYFFLGYREDYRRLEQRWRILLCVEINVWILERKFHRKTFFTFSISTNVFFLLLSFAAVEGERLEAIWRSACKSASSNTQKVSKWRSSQPGHRTSQGRRMLSTAFINASTRTWRRTRDTWRPRFIWNTKLPTKSTTTSSSAEDRAFHF